MPSTWLPGWSLTSFDVGPRSHLVPDRAEREARREAAPESEPAELAPDCELVAVQSQGQRDRRAGRVAEPAARVEHAAPEAAFAPHLHDRCVEGEVGLVE